MKDCIGEVIVYQSNSTEEIYESIFSFLDGFFVSRNFPEGFVRLERKDTRYSSVHFIVRGQVHLSSEIKIIPIEFQLRTVFEDVWGEVQHFLMYKNATLEQADNAEFRKSQGNRILNILKANLDACSEQANLAFFTLKSENPSASIKQARKGATSNLTSILAGTSSILGARSDDDVERLRSHISKAYQNLHNTKLSDEPEYVANLFATVLENINLFDEKWSSYVAKDSKGHAMYRYGVDMEKAAACYWIGQALNDRGIDLEDSRVANLDTASNYFERARQIYFKLTGIDGLASDPVLNYRIGQIYRKLSQYDLSIVYYRAAFEGMSDESWKDRGSIFEVLIPRHLAFIIWSQAEELVEKHIGFAVLEAMSVEQRRNNPIVQRYLDSLKEAFLLSFGVDAVKVSDSAADVSSIDDEKMFAFNNGLWYAVEYLNYGGRSEDLCKNGGVSYFDVNYYLKFRDFRAFSELTKIHISALDTLLRAAVHFEDSENGCLWMREFANRKRSDEWDGLEPWQKARFQLTIEKAQEKLNCV